MNKKRIYCRADAQIQVEGRSIHEGFLQSLVNQCFKKKKTNWKINGAQLSECREEKDYNILDHTFLPH